MIDDAYWQDEIDRLRMEALDDIGWGDRMERACILEQLLCNGVLPGTANEGPYCRFCGRKISFYECPCGQGNPKDP